MEGIIKGVFQLVISSTGRLCQAALILSVFSFAGCKGEAPTTSAVVVKLTCERSGIMSDAELERPGVYAQVDDFKAKVAEWSNCTELDPMHFPAFLTGQTIAAVSGDGYILWAMSSEAGIDYCFLPHESNSKVAVLNFRYFLP